MQLGVYNFQLLKADDFTLNYMRERPEKFPEVNIETALSKIKSLTKNFNSYEDFLVWFLKSTCFVMQTLIQQTKDYFNSTSSVETYLGT